MGANGHDENLGHCPECGCFGALGSAREPGSPMICTACAIGAGAVVKPLPRLDFGRWEAMTEWAMTAPIAQLADLEEEPLSRGELDQLVWLLDRGARHNQVVLVDGPVMTINGIEGAEVMGDEARAVALRLRGDAGAGAEPETRHGAPRMETLRDIRSQIEREIPGLWADQIEKVLCLVREVRNGAFQAGLAQRAEREDSPRDLE